MCQLLHQSPPFAKRHFHGTNMLAHHNCGPASHKHDILIQNYFDVGSPSSTLTQHQNNIGSIAYVYWDGILWDTRRQGCDPRDPVVYIVWGLEYRAYDGREDESYLSPSRIRIQPGQHPPPPPREGGLILGQHPRRSLNIKPH